MQSHAASLVARDVQSGDDVVLSPIAPGPYQTRGLSFSPDGRRLAFIETDPGESGATTTLKTMACSGGAPLDLFRVTEPESLSELVSWETGRRDAANRSG